MTTPDDRAALPYVHVLKTDTEVFDAVARGDKTHEIRRNDRNFLVGDTLVMKETRYTGQEMSGPEPRPLVYTGREETRVVSHVLEGYGLQPGWAILSFAASQPQPVNRADGDAVRVCPISDVQCSTSRECESAKGKCRKISADGDAVPVAIIRPDEPLWDHKGNVIHAAVDRLGEIQHIAASTSADAPVDDADLASFEVLLDAYGASVAVNDVFNIKTMAKTIRATAEARDNVLAFVNKLQRAPIAAGAQCQYAIDIGMSPEHRCKVGHCEYADMEADSTSVLRAIVHATQSGQDSSLILDENSPLMDAARAALTIDAAPIASALPAQPVLECVGYYWIGEDNRQKFCGSYDTIDIETAKQAEKVYRYAVPALPAAQPGEKS